MLDSLRDLTAIESGSGDREGLDRISQLSPHRLAALGAEVRFIEPDESLYRMHDTPVCASGCMVQGVFRWDRGPQDPADRAHGHRLPEGDGREAAVPRPTAIARTVSGSRTTSPASR